MRKITEIILHCSATPAGRDISAADINRWHRERGFRCIGYHYVIRLDGSIEHGRPESEIGAHCIGHNAQSIGICYIGGLSPDGSRPLDTRTPQQRISLSHLIRQLKERFPRIKIYGHRDFANKNCPCFDIHKEL